MDPRVQAELQAAPAQEHVYEDPTRGYRAYLVLDTIACGIAVGGVRIRPGVSLAEMRRAARTMSWKFRFTGIPAGGAKAGLDGAEDLPRAEKLHRLIWFRQQAAALIDPAIYRPGPDMGTDDSLVGQAFHNLAPATTAPGASRSRTSGYYTALSTTEAARAALQLRGQTWVGRTVAIEGFGSVGSHAAALLHRAGAHVVAISTSQGALYRPEGLAVPDLLRADNPLAGDPRARRLPCAELLRLPVDVLLPCGPGDTITPAVARDIAAPIIASGANHSFSWEAAVILQQRGCLAIPDFVANCGGVVGATLTAGGVPGWGIEHLFRHPYHRRVRALLRRALAENRPPMELALRELPPLAGGVTTSSATRHLLTRARHIVRHGLLPRRLITIPTYVYMAQRIAVPIR